MRRIYLDHAATTPLCAEAREAMSAVLDEFGNPSSLYEEGRRARALIDRSREAIAEELGCLFGEIVFTSSGTEAANLALIGVGLSRGRRNKILLPVAEHHAVLNCATALARLGAEVVPVAVDKEARIDLDDLEAKMSDEVLLVACMSANNELGSLNPIEQVRRLCDRHGALMFVDAVQSMPTAETGRTWSADIVALSAHKFGGPKGCGILTVRAGTPVSPWAFGGGQERDLRAGTENTVAIVGTAAALPAWRRHDPTAVQAVRDTFENALGEHLVRTVQTDRLPGHCHVLAPGSDSQVTLIRLDREAISASGGAACSSGSVEPSHVLLACGYSPSAAKSGLRFTFGPQNTHDEAIAAAEIVNRVTAPIAR